MKPFLLISGYDYYPSPNTHDWRGCYETYDIAYDALLALSGRCDWFEIVDLREWMNK